MLIRELEAVRLHTNSKVPGMAHASSLCLRNERLYCAWFSGSFEGSRDTAIVASIRVNDRWSAPRRIAKASAEPHWNPVLHHFENSLWLFFKVGLYPKRWRTLVARNSHEEVWTSPVELIPGDCGGRGPVKNKILVLSNGDWLAPASLEQDSGWTCFVDRSSDQGQSWIRHPCILPEQSSVSGAGIIQPSLWESVPGQVHMLTRSDLGLIFRADSADFGRSWTSAYPTTLPNNNSGLDLTYRQGTLILACNPISDPHQPRTPLTLFESADNGLSWEPLFVLESGPGEFSYPAIIATQKGFIVSYTENRAAIRVREFTVLQ